MKTTLKNIYAIVIIAAAGCMITLQVVYFPTRTGAQILSAPAGVAFALYALLFICNSPAVTRLTARLRHLTHREIKLFFAQVALWCVGISALVYSILTY